MADYIEKNVAIARLTALEIGDPCATMTDAKRQIADTRPADVAPVVHARWEPCFDENCRCRWGFGKCSNCGQEYYAHAIDHYKYCPICGAKMDGAT